MCASKTKTKRVEDLILPFDKKNTEGYNFPFYGINKEKAFMRTIADTLDLDNHKYKVVGKGVFVFSGMQTGRDVCIRIAVYEKDNPVLVSPAYTTFKVNDKEVLPLYLFMQFNRFEMDRYGWFLSDSSIRSNLDWDRFCEIEIPLPSIEVQQELVDTYNGLKALAEQNEALIPRLAEACQAYIIDCKDKYPSVPLGDYIEEQRNFNKDGLYDESVLQGVTSEGVFDTSKANTQGIDFTKYKIVVPDDFGYNPSRVNLGSIALRKESACIVSPMYVVFKIRDEKRDKLLPEFLNLWFTRKEFQRSTLFYAMGSVRDTFDMNLMKEVQIPLPPIEVQQAIVDVYRCMERARKIAVEARERLKTLCPALVQRAAKL